MSEQRKYPRFAVTNVWGKMLSSTDVQIINISIDGAAIETGRRLTLGQEYTLRLKLGEGDVRNVRGRVVWSMLSSSQTTRDGEVAPVYRAGIRFTNVLTGESEIVARFIDENKENLIEKRLFGVRFKVRHPNSAVIDMPHTFSIVKISLSGMLVETDTLFEIFSFTTMEITIDDRAVSVVGRVANCAEVRKDDERVIYEVGIEFVKMSEEDHAHLKDFLGRMEHGGGS